MFDRLKARWNFWRITGYKATETQLEYLLAPKVEEAHSTLFVLGRGAGKSTAVLVKACIEARRGAEIVLVYPNRQMAVGKFEEFQKLYKVPHMTQFQRHPCEAFFPSGGRIFFLSADSPSLRGRDPRSYRIDV